MKRLIAVLVMFSVFAAGLSASATDGFTYAAVGTEALAPGGLSVTINSLQIVEKAGSNQLVINYAQKNKTTDKKLDEGSFKLFFTDGSSEPQYGGFNAFFPGDGNVRNYTWEWLKGKEPWLIEWQADFFARTPSATGLKWKVGSSYPAPIAVPTPTPTPEPTFTVEPVPTVSETPVPTVTPTNAPEPSETSLPTPVAKKYSNCVALNKVYPGGVAGLAKWTNRGGKLKFKPVFNVKVFNLNKALDKDSDKIACER